jgi:anti-sigma B factor antagonist
MMNEIKISIPSNFAVEEAADLREKLMELTNKGNNNFVLNFSNCTFIDSTGLGVLVSIFKKVMETNGNFKIENVDENVMKVFKLTRLDKVFHII